LSETPTIAAIRPADGTSGTSGTGSVSDDQAAKIFKKIDTDGDGLGDNCDPDADGDGIVNGDETCDDGILDNSYGGCTPQCKRAAYCGDGNIDAAGHEECDNGTKNGADGLCTPSCKAIIYVPS